jgi:predicted kinase|nr:MAG TPA: polynucleotide kinase [Caudoviricetes sp.]
MEKRKLILCRGIQASGKSTWAKAWAKEDPEHRVRFNNDDIRNMLGEYWVPSREGMVTELRRSFACEATRKGYDIVIDNMNLNPKEVKWWEDIIKVANSITEFEYELEFKDFFVSVDECIRRDAMREQPMGAKVIKDTWRRYQTFIIKENIKKSLENKVKYVTGLPTAIIADMDGTLSLNTTGRPFYGDGAAEGMLTDIENGAVVASVRAMCDGIDAALIILTGREDTPEIRKATYDWLDRRQLLPDKLLMRPKGDYSPAQECKRAIYKKYIEGNYNVLAVFDDSQKCVDMWREEGLTCLQPNEGKF